MVFRAHYIITGLCLTHCLSFARGNWESAGGVRCLSGGFILLRDVGMYGLTSSFPVMVVVTSGSGNNLLTDDE